MRTSGRSVESRNLFLRSLDATDRAFLAPRLARTAVEPGALLTREDDPTAIVYFPEDVIVSIEQQAGDGQHVETAVVGYEGVVGWQGLVGSARSQQRAIVQMRGGTVLAIPFGELAAACMARRSLLSALMRFIEILMTQMAQAIVSHLRDPLDRRIGRWLMMRHDRVACDQLFIRHDEIARNLGARRAGVTDSLHVLEGDRLIRCYRGRIVIRDRAGLEALAGDSYGAAEGHYRTMIGPFGRDAGVARSIADSGARHAADDAPVVGVAAFAGPPPLYAR